MAIFDRLDLAFQPADLGKALRLAVAGCNALTWLSSAIVVGITGYFLNKYPHDQHLIFEMCIVSLTLRLLHRSAL